jgi:hypothetical protein
MSRLRHRTPNKKAAPWGGHQVDSGVGELGSHIRPFGLFRQRIGALPQTQDLKAKCYSNSVACGVAASRLRSWVSSSSDAHPLRVRGGPRAGVIAMLDFSRAWALTTSPSTAFWISPSRWSAEILARHPVRHPYRGKCRQSSQDPLV